MALHHAGPGEIVNLEPLGPELKHAKSVSIVKGRHFQAIRLVVQAGEEIPPHEVAGNITLHCLEGRIHLGLPGSAVELKADEWLYLEGGEPHSLRALEDSSLLLTILFDAVEQSRSRS